MRIILYTGKGGVGKTSVAAATACHIAQTGKRVLIMSTDQAHSLGDSFEKKLGNEPTMLEENLFAMEIDAVLENEKAWGGMQEYIKRLLTSRSGESIETEELLVFPGFEELFSLFKILEIYENAQYDVLIVDCAPTGETLSLLKFPGMFEGWIAKLLPVKRKALKIAGPLVEKVVGIPMPKDSMFDEIEMLCERMGRLQALMSDKDILSIRIVTTPEKIVVKEAKRNFSYLHLYDYNVDGIIVNKIYPKRSLHGYFSKWIENQDKSLQDIKESFGGIPVFYMEFLRNELRSIPRLKGAAEQIYQDENPEKVFIKETIFSLDREIEDETRDAVYWLRITLPFLEKSEMELFQKGEELTLIMKNERRSFVLPSRLHGFEVYGAKHEEGRLNIMFKEKDENARQSSENIEKDKILHQKG